MKSGNVQRQSSGGLAAHFVSDLHLQTAMPRTAARFLRFLRETAPQAPQLYLLGDIFEYWAGDDDMEAAFNAEVIAAIRALNQQEVRTFWIAGNRDFLAGEAFAEKSALCLLPDPSIVDIAGQRIVLTHGDQLCTDDHAYMEFRSQVRNPDWQTRFLAQPLVQRKRLIDEMRRGSRAAQRNKPAAIMDANNDAVRKLFDATGTSIMIHGHTHRPAMHTVDTTVRYVLPDWDLDTEEPRGGWLALGQDGQLTAVSAVEANPNG